MLDQQCIDAAVRSALEAAVPRAACCWSTPSSRYLYQELTKISPLVVVFGRDMPADFGGGVRGVALGPDDPLCEEWAVVTLGADICRALVARQVADADGHPGDQRFEFRVTTDRAMVTKAARDLLARVP